MSSVLERVVIGMDPHKRSVTIEVMGGDETILGGGRFGTDREGFQQMLAQVKAWPNRVWAIEGCSGIGRHVALRLLGTGDEVVDVPPKLSARTRVFASGQGRKTDATDAHSVALVGTRMAGLRPVVNDEQLAVLRILVDRRRSLGEEHTRMVSQLHALLLELIPGGAKKALSAAQAKALLAKVRPRDVAGKTRRRVAMSGSVPRPHSARCPRSRARPLLDCSDSGEQQRIARARLILKSPSLIRADEPTSALDHRAGLIACAAPTRRSRVRRPAGAGQERWRAAR
jgi:hypothetical protein